MADVTLPSDYQMQFEVSRIPCNLVGILLGAAQGNTEGEIGFWVDLGGQAAKLMVFSEAE